LSNLARGCPPDSLRPPTDGKAKLDLCKNPDFPKKRQDKVQ